MTEQRPPPGDSRQTTAAVDALGDVLGDDLLAVYLHGSAILGGPRPQSDIDLIAIVGAPVTAERRDRLLSVLTALSGRHPTHPGGPRPIEVMVFLRRDLTPPPFPARAEFVYGEWLRDAFVRAPDRSGPVSDPENTLILAQARLFARPLIGPPAAALLPEIAPYLIRRAMRDALPALVEGLAGDERNVLLTLARMWRTAVTGEFVTKDAAAAWAVARMPGEEAEALDLARRGYLGTAADDWSDRRGAAREAADFLRARVSEVV
ncbi:aminoglycoside adenylyltransferase domain-containing protein [Amaricoccus sp. W119]|uniref:aminoglycoside adenylyltransferase domain-containing protein n=1 Tax=Amaricoccus sp. W119 TaxID=3391833 RepID=UPI0039A73BAA